MSSQSISIPGIQQEIASQIFDLSTLLSLRVTSKSFFDAVKKSVRVISPSPEETFQSVPSKLILLFPNLVQSDYIITVNNLDDLLNLAKSKLEVATLDLSNFWLEYLVNQFDGNRLNVRKALQDKLLSPQITLRQFDQLNQKLLKIQLIEPSLNLLSLVALFIRNRPVNQPTSRIKFIYRNSPSDDYFDLAEWTDQGLKLFTEQPSQEVTDVLEAVKASKA